MLPNRTDAGNSAPCEPAPAGELADNEPIENEQRPADSIVDCASPPCLLHELASGSREFTY